MATKNLRADLLKLLDDKTVRDKICAIVANPNTSSSSSNAVVATPNEDGETIARLQSELSARSSEIAKLKGDLVRVEKSLACSERTRKDLEAQLNSALSQNEQILSRSKVLEKKVQNLESTRSAFQETYDLYMSLPDALRRSLKGYFRDTDLRTFVICGVQPENLRDFWDFCKNDISRGRLSGQRDVLWRIFKFFFDLINDSLGEKPQWILQGVKPGMAFDTANLSATPESSVSGQVTEVLWPGMLYAASKKVFRKSLVVVK